MAKQGLNEPNEIYRLIFENSDDVISILDLNMKILYGNQAYKRILGYSLDEVLGEDAIKFVHPKDVDLSMRLFQEGLRTKQKIAEIRIKHKNGSYIWFEIQCQIFKDLENKRNILLISRNINEKKDTIEKLIESEEKYRTILEQSIVGIFIIQDNAIKFVTQGMSELNEYSIEELSTWKIKELSNSLHPEDRDRVLQRMAKFAEFGSEIAPSNTFRIITKSGKIRWLNSYTRTIHYKGKAAMMVLALDATEQMEAKLKLVESEKKYQKAYNRSEFLKDIFVHDINNILQNILSSSEILTFYLNNPEQKNKLEEILEIISEQVKRGSNLILNVQKISNIEEHASSLAPIEIVELLNQAIKNVTQNLDKNTYEILVDLSENRFFINADYLLIDVFENIILNAIKHNDQDIKKIHVKFYREENENQRLIRMEFKDNGLGIENFWKDKVFLRGFEGNSDRRGMGLGLYLVKTIINIYGGLIRVEDRIKGDHSKGSKFIIIIPEAIL